MSNPMWRLIDENTPEGTPILVNAPKAHRGRDSCEVVVLHRDDGYITFWTNGGPNGGSDFLFQDDEMPTHWQPIPELPR